MDSRDEDRPKAAAATGALTTATSGEAIALRVLSETK